MLFFLVYGDAEVKTGPLGHYGTAGIPPGFRAAQVVLSSNPCVIFRDTPSWSDFQKSHPDVAEAIGKSAKCTVFRGEIEDSKNLDYLRDVVGSITYSLDHGGIAVYDLITFRWWTARDWKERAFPAQDSALGTQIAHNMSDDDSHPGTFWHYTHGLRKFGRPDLSVHGAVPENHKKIGEVIKRLAEWEVAGKVFHDGQRLQGPDLPAGLVVHLQGGMDDVNFNNAHWEIEWPGLGHP